MPASHSDRQTALAVAVADHRGEIQHHPAVALLTIGVQLMVMGA
jgi:acid phosphatase family membrane protein YuiD